MNQSTQEVTPDETLQLTEQELTERLEQQKAEATSAILSQIGVKDEKELPELLASLEQYREAVAANQTEADKLAQASNQLTAEKQARQEVEAKYQALLQENILRKHGITDDEDLAVYAIRVSRLMDGKTDFVKAAEAYFKKYPYKQNAPQFATTGKTQVNTKTSMNDVLFGALRK